MRINCPSCATQYEVPDEAIPLAGRVVQCGVCHTSWHQSHPGGAAGVVPFSPPASEAPDLVPDGDADAEGLRALLAQTVEEDDAPAAEDSRIDAERVFDYDDTKKFEYSAEEASSNVHEDTATEDPDPTPVEETNFTESDEPSEEVDAALEAEPAVAEDHDTAPHDDEHPDVPPLEPVDTAPEDASDERHAAEEASAPEEIVEHTQDVVIPPLEPSASDDPTPEDVEEDTPAIEEPTGAEDTSDDRPIETLIPPIAPPPLPTSSEDDDEDGDPEPGLSEDAFEQMKARRAERRARKRAFFDEVRAQREGNVVPRDPPPETAEEAAPSEAAAEEGDALANLRDLMKSDDEPAVEAEARPTTRPKRERPPRPSDIAPDVSDAEEPKVETPSPAVADALPTSMAALRAASDGGDFSLEDEEPTSRRALGFALAIMLFAIAFGIYVTAPALAQFAPVLAPALEAYVLFVDQLRAAIEQGFAQASALFQNLIG
ncbi:MAG: zinc-ribbon domain-containing protein [Pseudomonadota bacterium]